MLTIRTIGANIVVLTYNRFTTSFIINTNNNKSIQNKIEKQTRLMFHS